MNLPETALFSFLPRLGKVPLRFTFPKTWKQRGLEINPSVFTQTNTVGVNLNCNLFYTDNAVSRTGIVIKPNTQAMQFGYYTDENAYRLSGNVWPTTTTDRSEVPAGNQDVNAVWYSPSNWTSIVNNNSSGNVYYYRYKNEFVGTFSSPSLVDINYYTGSLKAYTDANVPAPTGSGYQKICDNTAVENVVYFPTPYIQNDNSKSIGKTSTIKTSMQGDGVSITSLDEQLITGIKLLDVTGRVVYSKAGLEVKAFKVPVECLSKGTYVLQVQNGNGETFSSKLIR